jgi:hypothetical protein
MGGEFFVKNKALFLRSGNDTLSVCDNFSNLTSLGFKNKTRIEMRSNHPFSRATNNTFRLIFIAVLSPRSADSITTATLLHRPRKEKRERESKIVDNKKCITENVTKRHGINFTCSTL